MAVIQPIVDLVELCSLHGVQHAVLSPGSRSAALTLAFDQHPSITTHMVMDERAAGFIALGMAQQLKQTVVLVCTSGSAAYNYAPAVTEAFFQKVPLLILSADRPPEWIHQQDGQTIYQSGIFGKHVKKSFDFPVDYVHADSIWYANRMVNEALLLVNDSHPGPVHINVPIREPFYPEPHEKFESHNVRKITRLSSTTQLTDQDWQHLRKEFAAYRKIMIAVGQMDYDKELIEVLQRLAQDPRVVIVGDSISNLPNRQEFVLYLDTVVPLVQKNKEAIPDLLVTIGNSFLSKSFKKFIRTNTAIIHWHVGDCVEFIDSFSILSLQIPISSVRFIQEMPISSIVTLTEKRNIGLFKEIWRANTLKVRGILASLLEKDVAFSDIWAVHHLLKQLPERAQLHLANSMSVRYVNFLAIPDKGIKVFANRGTSGIDGCVSTAIGAALAKPDEDVYLLVGDVAFFYDRNGLLIEQLPKNLKIVVLNNSGGNIFRIIEGASAQTEVTRLFETRHSFRAECTAADSKIDYYVANTKEIFKRECAIFIGSDKVAILEVLTSPTESSEAFKFVKNAVQDRSSTK